MKKIFSFTLFTLFFISQINYSQFVTISEISPGLRTTYDIQSNGSAHLIELDGTNQNLHAVFTVDTSVIPGGGSRKVHYFFSSDYGDTWTDYGPNPATGRSGFAMLCFTSDGSALIGMNTNNGGGNERTQWFADIAPGAGTFTRLDPGVPSLPALWPVGIATGSILNPVKFVFVAGTYTNRGLSLTGSTFSGYVNEPDLDNSFKCALARSQSGKIGLAYIAEGTVIPGRVKFKESTDDGVTWSVPATIWDPALNNNNGAFRGIDIGYDVNTPNIVFETVKYVSGNPDLHSTARIMFWSPVVNSGIPVIVDSSNQMTGANLNNDGYAPVCRPVIGYHNAAQLLLVAYSKTRTDTLNTNNFFDLYCRYSWNGGATWSTSPKQISNNTGPLTDNKYVSISEFNYSNYPANFNLSYQQDSISGSYVNGAAMHKSKLIYAKVSIPYGGAVTTIGSEIPSSFSLKQNFPNPFNPVTYIDFDIPKQSNVVITIYSVSGEEVVTIVDQRLSSGKYRADWNAMHYASGVYFYTIRAGEFYRTRKMVVIK